jgi:phosphohistidine phosphatase SixA
VRAIFIRHGESTGNAGVPCHDLATIELTERGHEQARAVAASWTEAPALIVTSPYTRTRQTAAPTIARWRAGGSLADRGVHLSATGALERHAQRRADAAPRTLLARGRS